MWSFVGALFLLAGVVYTGPIWGLTKGSYELALPWWLLAAGMYCANRFLIHLEFRRDVHSVSLSEVPMVLALFFASPREVLLAVLVSQAFSLLHGASAVKRAFNFANSLFAFGVGLLLFHSLSTPRGGLTMGSWGAALAATLATSLIEVTMIGVAMYLATGATPYWGWRKSFVLGGTVTAINTSLALMVTTVLWFDPKAAPLLLAPTLLLFVAYRAYLWQRRKSENLESLYESTRTLHHSIDSEPATRELLATAKEMFRSERAEILLFASIETEVHVRITLDADDELHILKFNVLDPNEGVWARVASEDRALLVPRPIRDERLAAMMAKGSMQDAMVAPLHGSETVIGTMSVSNRIIETYRKDDLQLFETLANHASVSLENARLMDRLREEAAEKEFQALHDSLTGLPNRTLFRDRLEQALLANSDTGSMVGIVLMDLDHFKEINDTLGHHNGDLMLEEVASRLRSKVTGDVTVARFSGDEFALLLPRVNSLDEIVAAVTDVRAALAAPFHLAEVEVDVGVSMGIAIHPLHGDDANTLIQRADVAMYVAKETHSGFEIYSTDRDGYSPARLALASELRQAIEREELIVHYQPKADIVTGRITGAEALVRWIHPTRGFMPPDEFIPLAEHTGLIRPLTTLVLRSALQQCNAWSAVGLDLEVSVNLSVRSLLDLHLPQSVDELLREFDVPAARLVLEITESSIMADPIRAADVVDRLHELGIGLAIDDFGTGYSSLAYLKKLPVDEIKVDKSFVMSMMENENDAVIVRSTIDLGRNLGLRVVAEGVESREMWDLLVRLGCDTAQGFFLSRPLPPEELGAWLAARAVELELQTGSLSRPA